MNARRAKKRLARASKARPAREPGTGKASPDLLRWRSARRFTAHLLMFLGGLVTLTALVREPTLRESAGALLVMWGAGLCLWGFLVLQERRSLRAYKARALVPERSEVILPVRSAAELGTLPPGLSPQERGKQQA